MYCAFSAWRCLYVLSTTVPDDVAKESIPKPLWRVHVILDHPWSDNNFPCHIGIVIAESVHIEGNQIWALGVQITSCCQSAKGAVSFPAGLTCLKGLTCSLSASCHTVDDGWNKTNNNHTSGPLPRRERGTTRPGLFKEWAALSTEQVIVLWITHYFVAKYLFNG